VVYLIWTSRSFEELCLFDSALVDLASNESFTSVPWKLVVSVHYTGQKKIETKHFYCATVGEDKDLDLSQALPEDISQIGAKKEDCMSQHASQSIRLSHPDIQATDQSASAPKNLASEVKRVTTFYQKAFSSNSLFAAGTKGPLVDQPLLVPTPSNSPLLYAALAILCFFGAYGGLLLPTWYQVNLAASTTNGAMYFALGMLYVVCIMAGSMIPPLCLLFAIAAVRKIFTSRRSRYQVTKGLGAAFFSPSSIQVSSSGGVCLTSKITGNSIPVQTRRPDIKMALKRVLDQHGGEAEVPDYVGGPESLMVKTRVEAESLNNESFVPKGPYLWFKNVVAW